MAWIEILKDEKTGKLHEVTYTPPGLEHTLCFQHCEYHYDAENSQTGYRFIWRRLDGSLQAARGQARIPSLSVMMLLIGKACEEGWGTIDCDYEDKKNKDSKANNKYPEFPDDAT